MATPRRTDPLTVALQNRPARSTQHGPVQAVVFTEESHGQSQQTQPVEGRGGSRSLRFWYRCGMVGSWLVLIACAAMVVPMQRAATSSAWLALYSSATLIGGAVFALFYRRMVSTDCIRCAQAPPGVSGWNWGAFLLTPAWSIGNGIPLRILAPYLLSLCIPYVNVLGGVLGALFFAVRGSSLAWRYRDWKSPTDFRRAQLRWMWAGICIVALGAAALWLASDNGLLVIQ